MKTLISTYFRNPCEFSYIDKIRMLLSVPIKYKNIDKFRQCASRKHYIYPSTATDLHYPSDSAADTIIFFIFNLYVIFFFSPNNVQYLINSPFSSVFRSSSALMCSLNWKLSETRSSVLEWSHSRRSVAAI